MIDVGFGIRTLKKYFGHYGLSLSQIKNILVTHDHADHIKSIGNISKKFDIPVYATAIVHQGIERNYCVKTRVPSCNKRIIENGLEEIVGSFRVSSFHVPHDSMDCVGYSIRYKSLTIVLVTDVGTVTDEIKKNINLADYLIIESNHDEAMLKAGLYSGHLKQRVFGPYGHLSNQKCAQVLSEQATLRLKHIWLCHLSEENNNPELAHVTIEKALAEAGKNIKVDVLKRKIPTGIFTLFHDNELDGYNNLFYIKRKLVGEDL